MKTITGTTLKKITTAASAGLLAMAASTAANAEGGFGFSANAGVTSDYRFRGISQSDKSPAVQAGVDFEYGGFYAGTWASQVDFDYGESETKYEQDFYFGYAGELSESVSYDVGYIYYAYHKGGNDEDYQEIYGSLGVSDFTFGLAYSNDYWAESGKFYYLSADYSLGLPAELTLDLHLGLNLFAEDDIFFVEPDPVDRYIDYSVSIGKEFGGLALSAAVVGTDLSKNECWATDWCKAGLVATATYTW